MSEIKAVLLIPEEGDPHGLLREGPCGSRPPMTAEKPGYSHVRTYFEAPEDCYSCDWCGQAWPCADAGKVAERPRWVAVSDGYIGPKWTRALVLAWDGEPVAEGLIQLRKVGLENISTIPAIDWPDGTVRLPAWVYSFDHLVKWSGRFAQWGTVIRIDAEGREVSDE